MSLRTVARKYAADTHRTKSAWVVTALFAVVFGFIGWSSGYSYGGEVNPLVAGGITNAAAVLVPLATLALGHGAVAGARESGSLRVLLAYPHSRRDVAAGAFLGRLGPILLAVTVGLVVAPMTYALRVGQLPSADYLTLVGFVYLWTLFATALAVGVSALVTTGRRAIAGGLGTYIGFLFVWDWLPSEIVRRTVPRDQRYPRPEWAQLWTSLDPVSGYTDATRLLRFRPDEPLAVFETMPFLAAVIAVWAVVPMALALWRFPRTDL
ncbi:ABC transporter permease [Halolamina litorea]|uniref:ABC transporter permease n=1 Tax=Halolamina litorea TaxID=1515593 RepID=A0ABD6BSC4_9EURY|nr:ABC transporter permease subunit [Halolamina litorea]